MIIHKNLENNDRTKTFHNYCIEIMKRNFAWHFDKWIVMVMAMLMVERARNLHDQEMAPV
jgi:hypothetical protein